MECCNTLQYLEGAAYIAIVLAVLGVPHMLTYYFERRERADDRAAAECRHQEERAERQRRADQADAERRHLEMMTALVAIAERNGHPPPAPAANPDASALIAQMQQRIADLENNVQELQHRRNGNGSGHG